MRESWCTCVPDSSLGKSSFPKDYTPWIDTMWNMHTVYNPFIKSDLSELIFKSWHQYYRSWRDLWSEHFKKKRESSWATAHTEYWATWKTELLLFGANFRTHWCILWLWCLTLFQESAWNGRGMPEPAREREISCSLTIFGLQSGSFLHSFCLSDMRGSMNINHCFYHLLWKGSLCVWMAGKPQTCFSLCGITMSRKHFSRKEKRGDLFEHKSRCVEGKLGCTGWIICPFRFV